jgi:hypothetical protein
MISAADAKDRESPSYIFHFRKLYVKIILWYRVNGVPRRVSFERKASRSLAFFPGIYGNSIMP